MTEGSRAGKAAHTISISRMVGLATAAALLGGQERLADALGIQVRSLRAKFAAERGVSADDLLTTADALDRQAARITDHARKLREEASSTQISQGE